MASSSRVETCKNSSQIFQPLKMRPQRHLKHQEPTTQWQSIRFQMQRDTNTEITNNNTPNRIVDSLLNWWAGNVLKHSLSCRQRQFRTPNHWKIFVLCWRYSSRCLLWYRRQSNWSKTLLGYQLSHMVKFQTNQRLLSDLYHHQETNVKDEDDFLNVQLLLFNNPKCMAAQQRFTAFGLCESFRDLIG